MLPIIGAYVARASASYKCTSYCKVPSVSHNSIKYSNYTVLQAGTALLTCPTEFDISLKTASCPHVKMVRVPVRLTWTRVTFSSTPVSTETKVRITGVVMQ